MYFYNVINLMYVAYLPYLTLQDSTSVAHNFVVTGNICYVRLTLYTVPPSDVDPAL